MNKSLVLLKPGVLQRRIVGEVIQRFERKGLKIIGLKLLKMSREMAETHYAEHRGKDFYEKLIDYSISGPLIALVLEGDGAIPMIRTMIGPTDPKAQLPGSIRGDFAFSTRLNIVHASDSPSSAEREIALFFTGDELVPWEDGNGPWF